MPLDGSLCKDSIAGRAWELWVPSASICQAVSNSSCVGWLGRVVPIVICVLRLIVGWLLALSVKSDWSVVIGADGFDCLLAYLLKNSGSLDWIKSSLINSLQWFRILWNLFERTSKLQGGLVCSADLNRVSIEFLCNKTASLSHLLSFLFSLLCFFLLPLFLLLDFPHVRWRLRSMNHILTVRYMSLSH